MSDNYLNYLTRIQEAAVQTGMKFGTGDIEDMGIFREKMKNQETSSHLFNVLNEKGFNIGTSDEFSASLTRSISYLDSAESAVKPAEPIEEQTIEQDEQYPAYGLVQVEPIPDRQEQDELLIWDSRKIHQAAIKQLGDEFERDIIKRQESLVTPLVDITSGMWKGISEMSHALGGFEQRFRKEFNIDGDAWLEVVSKVSHEQAEILYEMGEESDNLPEKIAKEFFVGAGHMAWTLPMIMALARTVGPAALPLYMSAMGAGTTLAEGGSDIEALKAGAVGAVEGATLHGIFSGLGLTPIQMRMSVGFAMGAFAGVNAQYQEHGLNFNEWDWADISAEGLLFSGLTATGRPKGVTIRVPDPDKPGKMKNQFVSDQALRGELYEPILDIEITKQKQHIKEQASEDVAKVGAALKEAVTENQNLLTKQSKKGTKLVYEELAEKYGIDLVEKRRELNELDIEIEGSKSKLVPQIVIEQKPVVQRTTTEVELKAKEVERQTAQSKLPETHVEFVEKWNTVAEWYGTKGLKDETAGTAYNVVKAIYNVDEVGLKGNLVNVKTKEQALDLLDLIDSWQQVSKTGAKDSPLWETTRTQLAALAKVDVTKTREPVKKASPEPGSQLKVKTSEVIERETGTPLPVGRDIKKVSPESRVQDFIKDQLEKNNIEQSETVSKGIDDLVRYSTEGSKKTLRDIAPKDLLEMTRTSAEDKITKLEKSVKQQGKEVHPSTLKTLDEMQAWANEVKKDLKRFDRDTQDYKEAREADRKFLQTKKGKELLAKKDIQQFHGGLLILPKGLAKKLKTQLKVTKDELKGLQAGLLKLQAEGQDTRKDREALSRVHRDFVEKELEHLERKANSTHQREIKKIHQKSALLGLADPKTGDLTRHKEFMLEHTGEENVNLMTPFELTQASMALAERGKLISKVNVILGPHEKREFDKSLIGSGTMTAEEFKTKLTEEYNVKDVLKLPNEGIQSLSTLVGDLREEKFQAQLSVKISKEVEATKIVAKYRDKESGQVKVPKRGIFKRLAIDKQRNLETDYLMPTGEAGLIYNKIYRPLRAAETKENQIKQEAQDHLRKEIAQVIPEKDFKAFFDENTIINFQQDIVKKTLDGQGAGSTKQIPMSKAQATELYASTSDAANVRAIVGEWLIDKSRVINKFNLKIEKAEERIARLKQPVAIANATKKLNKLINNRDKAVDAHGELRKVKAGGVEVNDIVYMLSKEDIQEFRAGLGQQYKTIGDGFLTVVNKTLVPNFKALLLQIEKVWSKDTHDIITAKENLGEVFWARKMSAGIQKGDVKSIARDLTSTSFIKGARESITHERKPTGKPIRIKGIDESFNLTLGRIAKFSSHHIATNKAMEVITHPTFRRTIRAKYGDWYLRDLEDGIIQQRGLAIPEKTVFEKIGREVVKRVHIPALFKVHIWLLQPTSELLILGEVPKDARQYYMFHKRTSAFNKQIEEFQMQHPDLRARRESAGHLISTPQEAEQSLRDFIYANDRGVVNKALRDPLKMLKLFDIGAINNIWAGSYKWGKAKGLQGEELTKFANDWTVKLIDRTQPSWNTLSRSGWARDGQKSFIALATSMFSSQRNKIFNIGVRNYDTFKRGDQSFNQMLTNMAPVVVSQAIVGAIRVAFTQYFYKGIVPKDWRKFIADTAFGIMQTLTGTWIGMGDLLNIAIDGAIAAVKQDSSKMSQMREDPISALSGMFEDTSRRWINLTKLKEQELDERRDTIEATVLESLKLMSYALPAGAGAAKVGHSITRMTSFLFKTEEMPLKTFYDMYERGQELNTISIQNEAIRHIARKENISEGAARVKAWNNYKKRLKK